VSVLISVASRGSPDPAYRFQRTRRVATPVMERRVPLMDLDSADYTTMHPSAFGVSIHTTREFLLRHPTPARTPARPVTRAHPAYGAASRRWVVVPTRSVTPTALADAQARNGRPLPGRGRTAVRCSSTPFLRARAWRGSCS
jgi:hypothetical protein